MNIELKQYETVESTNDIAKRLAEEGAPEGTIVIAEEQTGGRGRKGDYWHSPKGGLWFSLILRPDVGPQKSIILPLLAGMAIHRTLKKYGVDSRIKLPNDVMVGGKKLCGILCENRVAGERVKFVVVGIGLNVKNDTQDVGIALKDLIIRPPDVLDLLYQILKEFMVEYQQFTSLDYYFGDGFQ